MIEVLYIENEELIDGKHTKAISHLLGEKERLKYLSYRRWQDRQAYLLGKLLVMTTLHAFGRSPALIGNLRYTNFNRPYITGAGFDFNISHSGTVVICATSRDQTVGIDVELIHKIDLSDFSYILNESDNSHIKASDDKYKTFFKIWSGKEAVLKADGCGLIDNLHEVKLFSDTALLMEKVFYIKELIIKRGYSSCIASSTPLANISIEKVLLSESLKKIL